MKILQLCPKPPVPATDGGCLAMDAITKGLLDQGAELRIFTLSTSKHPFQVGKIPDSYIQSTRIVHAPIETEPSTSDFLASFFNGSSYLLDRFYSTAAAKKLVKLLKEETFDIIHLEGLFMSGYIADIRKYSKAPIVLRSHNVETEIWSSLAQNQAGPRKLILNHLARRLGKKEIEAWKKADAVAAITENDAEKIRKVVSVPVKVFPFGLNDPGSSEIPVEENTVFHLGAMDWMPNQEGIDWFLKEVWPQISREHPSARFHLAGRSMPERYNHSLPDRVFTDGEVSSAYDYIKHKEIMVVPLFTGSGIRIKILEGMMLGKPVITTPAGIRGIPAQAGKEVLVAKTASEFISHISRCLTDKPFARELGINARNFVLARYLNSEISSGLLAFYNSLLQK